MSRKEDQDLEIEALQSIYPDELTLKNSSPYEIDLSLLPNSATGAEGPNHVGVTLQISFPEDYPDVAPTILVRKDLGLGDKDVLPALDKVIAETAAENAGVAMVYSIAERVRDWLREHNEPEGSGSAYDEMMKKQRQKAKAEAAATAAASGGGAAYDPSAPSGGRGGKISAALDAEEALRKKREGECMGGEESGGRIQREEGNACLDSIQGNLLSSATPAFCLSLLRPAFCCCCCSSSSTSLT